MTTIDDETLTLLLAISDLTGQKHSAKHLMGVWERALKQVREYRQQEARFENPRG
jgi:hypothetical protein